MELPGWFFEVDFRLRLLIMISCGENYLSSHRLLIFHGATFMTFNSFQELYLVSSRFEYRMYQHQSSLLGFQLPFKNPTQKNFYQQLALPLKSHSWNFLIHMLFSNLNYRQINSFLFDSNYHLFFRTDAKMDFIAD